MAVVCGFHAPSNRLRYGISITVFKHFYYLTSLSQYLISLAPKKPREAKTWADIAEYMSIQDQTIVDERELLEEHQFMLDLELVCAFLITIYACLINVGLLGNV